MMRDYLSVSNLFSLPDGTKTELFVTYQRPAERY